jgi:phosphoenolpyruvate carboxylase
MTDPLVELKNTLSNLREQSMQLSDINPISALSDIVSDKLYQKTLTKDDIQVILDELGSTIWQSQASALAEQTGLTNLTRSSVPELLSSHRDILAKVPMDKPRYRAVFTAHPVFALQPDNSSALCDAAEAVANGKAAIQPNQAYQPRVDVTLRQEHDEAMKAQKNGRNSIRKINDFWLKIKAEDTPNSWRDTLPIAFGLSTWVGYDLDGRADITWLDSLILRLSEKHMALELYDAGFEDLVGDLQSNQALSAIRDEIVAEAAACAAEVTALIAYQNGHGDFIAIMNEMTERSGKLTKSRTIANRLHDIAKALSDDDAARSVMVLAADMATHGFGMGEIHLRINAVQLRNAMRLLDGRGVSVSDGGSSARLLMDRLASRIKNEDPWQINYAVVDNEAATARRQLMLAAQFIKHIDNDQPVRLLIAECERPITYMSALYLAHKLGVSDKLDISPLFETTFGLEHGAEMMSQLFRHDVVQAYVRRRGRIAMQFGFSDAGRFMGQIAANLAIERLQIKITDLCAKVIGSDVELLMFNTHGESLGRGCARPTIMDRQNFILTPFARARA